MARNLIGILKNLMFMKRILYLAFIIPFFLLSCQKSPEASFYTDVDEVVVGQEVLFHNDSHNASSYEWDFGDGYISNEDSPYHTFNSTGTFDVKLTATGKNGDDDQSLLTVNVVVPTLLVVEVREWNDEYVVPDASVRLYGSITDWDAEKNIVLEGFTGEDGIAVFANLDPYVYYVDVWEQNHDNYAFRDEPNGLNYLRTPEVLPNTINWFVAWVDVVDHGKGTARSSGERVIRKIERKDLSRTQPGVKGTENWKELYERRVNK